MNRRMTNNNRISNIRRNRKKGLTPRQKQMITRKIGLLLSIIAIAFVLSILIGGIGNKVKAADNYHKYYTSIEIMPGDTLTGYFEEYGENYKNVDTYVKEVCMINSIDEDDITAGNYLIIPYYSLEVK